MTKTETFEIVYRALDLLEAGHSRDATRLMHGLVGGSQDDTLQSIVGGTVYDVLMEIYIFITSGDLSAEGRSGGFESVADCRAALSSLASKS